MKKVPSRPWCNATASYCWASAPRPRRPEDPRPQRAEFPRREDAARPDLDAKIVAVSADSNKITVEEPSRHRGEAGTLTRDILVDDKTQQVYFQVGPNGAKPTVGYTAAVYLVQGSKNAAARVMFTGIQSLQRSLAGRLGAVSADHKIMTLEVPNLRCGESREMRKLDLKITERPR
jgi:hypothetical protein